MFIALMKVLGVGLSLLLFLDKPILADDSVKNRRGNAEYASTKSPDQNSRGRGLSGGSDQASTSGNAHEKQSRGISREKVDTTVGDNFVNISKELSDQLATVVNKRTLPGTMGEILARSMPFPTLSPQGITDVYGNGIWVASRPAAQNQKYREDTALGKASDDSSQPSPRQDLRYVEIEVSHSGHTFKLLAGSLGGDKQVLHECRVGLGGPGFPTPVGQYFVTHIYDDDPWWIPPKDRAWAAGDKPSRRVYGGTMAPLLKKRDVKSKKGQTDIEDKVSGQIKLEDYGYRFHGTNSPRSIGRNQSHGCVRMLPPDAKKVASLIKEYVGTMDRKDSENGSYVILKSPVRLNLVK